MTSKTEKAYEKVDDFAKASKKVADNVMDSVAEHVQDAGKKFREAGEKMKQASDRLKKEGK